MKRYTSFYDAMAQPPRRTSPASERSSAECRRSTMRAPVLLPRAQYAKIHALMPVLCVDVVVTDLDEVLLVKRATEPLRGEFFVPGGRVQRGETLEEAAHRIVREEVGLAINWPRFIGLQEFFWEKDPFGHGKGTHTVSAVYTAARRAGNVRLNQSLSDCVWQDFDETARAADLPRHVRRMLWRAREAMGGIGHAP